MHSVGRPRLFRFAACAAVLLMIASAYVSWTAPMASAADGRAVMFLVDTSGSMAGERLAQAKSALNAGVDALEAGDRAGLQRYGGECGNGGDLLVPPAVDNRGSLHSAVEGLAAGGGTPTPDALRAAAANFPPDAAEKILILVSDGQSSCGDPCPVARELKEQQGVSFKAFTVGFETAGQAETELSCIAEVTGGSYFPVSDTEGIRSAIKSALGGQTESFTVMSFNVRGNNYSKDRFEPGGPTDYSDAIAEHNADVVGLQEINPGETNTVIRRLGWAEGCAPPYCFWKRVALTNEGTAILSRYPLSNTETWKLPRSPQDNHDRHLMRATLTARGQKMFFYNTHLASETQQAPQTEFIRAQIEKDRRSQGSKPFRPVLVGDMNVRPWDPAIPALSGTMTDAWAALHPYAADRSRCDVTKTQKPLPADLPECGLTSSVREKGRNPKKVDPDKRIDYVFVGKSSGYEVADVKIPQAEDKVRNGSGSSTKRYWEISDHLPMAATLRTTTVGAPHARVHVTGWDGNVQEYALSREGDWSWTDVTRLTTGAVPSGGQVASYSRDDGTVGVVYRATDGRIHQLVGDRAGNWRDENLSAAAGLPATGRLPSAQRADGSPRVYLAPQPRVVYRTGENRLHELSFDGTRWNRSDLTLLAGVAAVRGAQVRDDPYGYASPAPRVVYRGADNRVHEMYLGPAGWVHADLNALANRGADVRGAPMGYLSPSGARVIYRGAGNRVHELFSPSGAGGWRFADLSRLSGTSAGVSAEPWGMATPLATVLFRDSAGHVWQLVQQPSGTWTSQRLPTTAGFGRAEGRPAGYLATSLTEPQRVVYRDRVGRVRELRLTGGGWQEADLTRLAGAPTTPPLLTGDPWPVAAAS